jgi:polyhydroxybutyrate depolymerase
MHKALRVLRFCLVSLLALAALCGALFGYFIYSPDPAVPTLSGALTRGSIEVGGLNRTYRAYLPRSLAKAAPLLLVMHGSGESGAQARTGTGYGFERLADEHGFAVVYPDAYTFDWNDCSNVGAFSANGRDVDDLGFLSALVDKFTADIGVDRNRVFATGVSAGGSMAIRLALEAPSRFRAVAAVAANVPAPQSFKCQPAGPGTSVMVMNGTQDPLVPFAGGEVNLLGLFYKAGHVLSSRASGQYFADRNGITGPPTTTQAQGADGFGVEQTLWRNDAGREVAHIAILGGGHGMPQPHWRRPRLLGPSPMAPDGPALIWDFFSRQRP